MHEASSRALANLGLVQRLVTQPLSVPFIELVKHRGSMMADTLSVRAYALTSFTSAASSGRAASARKEHQRLRARLAGDWPSEARTRASQTFAMRLFKVLPHRRLRRLVHVVGTFRYIDLTPAPTPRLKKVTRPTPPGASGTRRCVAKSRLRHVWPLYKTSPI